MAMLGFEVNEENLTPEDLEGGDFTPLPDGDYTAKITDAEMIGTASGGEGVKLELRITGPTHQNRKIFDFINTVNSNDTAQKIGRGTLQKIRIALGLATLTNTDQLIDGDVAITIGQKPAQGKYKAGNSVKNYKAIGSNEDAAPVQAARPAPAASAPQATAAKRPSPWAKK